MSASNSYDPTLLKRNILVGNIIFVFVLCLTVAVQIGWYLNIPFLQSIVPGLPSMNPLTAVLLFLLSLSSLLHASRFRYVSYGLAWIVCVIAFVRVIDYLWLGVNVDMWFVQLLFGDSIKPSPVALGTALGIGMLSLAQVVRVKAQAHSVIFSVFLISAFTLGLLPFVSYIYGAKLVNSIFIFSAMAVHTALCIFMSATGIFFQSVGIYRHNLIISKNSGGYIFRVLIPVLFFVAIPLGSIILVGANKLYYDLPIAITIYTMSAIAISASLICKVSLRIDKLDVEKSTFLKEIEARKEFDEAILSEIGEGVAVVDANGKITYFNKMAKLLLGDDVTGLPDSWQEKYGVFDGETLKPLPAESQPLFMALQGTVVRKKILFIRNKNIPKGRYISVTATPVGKHTGSLGAVAVFHDVSDERAVDRAKSEFVYLISHQLKTPSTTIKWYTEMLLGGQAGVLSPQQTEYLQAIFDGNQNAIELITSLLEISRLDLGTVKIEKGPVLVKPVIESVLTELKITISQKDLRVVVDIPDGKVVVQTDPKMFRIIVQNLVSNAVAYTPNSKGVRIQVRVVGKQLEVVVADDGCGIPQADQDKIFTKFFRAPNAQALKSGGNGLGLYMTKAITETLGGEIRFVSVEDQGTTFTVTLPL